MLAHPQLIIIAAVSFNDRF